MNDIEKEFDSLSVLGTNKIAVLEEICWLQQDKINHLEELIVELREELRTSIECVYRNLG